MKLHRLAIDQSRVTRAFGQQMIRNDVIGLWHQRVCDLPGRRGEVGPLFAQLEIEKHRPR